MLQSQPSEELKLYYVTDQYTDYLRNFESHVWSNSDKGKQRPYVGIVMDINNHKFYAPLTSVKPKYQNWKDSYIINDGDIIFSWSGSLLVDIWCGGRCGLNQHLFKVTSASYNKWFYYMWTRYHLERFIAIAKDKATTMGHIQRKHLSEAKVLIPEPNTLAFMDSVMQPIIDLVIANKVENKTLSTIRDTLLPKLMSGEIRVPVGEVM
jgi:type I restriction enzyme S subunit